MKFRNVEFRWSKFNEKYELVKWYKNDIGGVNCYTLALFEKGKEGWDMRTVGDRFFEDKDAWVVGKYGLEFLNAIFEIEEDESEDGFFGRNVPLDEWQDLAGQPDKWQETGEGV